MRDGVTCWSMSFTMFTVVKQKKKEENINCKSEAGEEICTLVLGFMLCVALYSLGTIVIYTLLDNNQHLRDRVQNVI